MTFCETPLYVGCEQPISGIWTYITYSYLGIISDIELNIVIKSED